MMNPTLLHYVYDPLCGWCYGAAPLLKVAAGVPGLAIELHAGGLWLGDRRQPMGATLRQHVRPHDERIEALTGQHFGERYFNSLLLDTQLTLDSEPPIRAIMAVTALGGDGLALLQRIQTSHYRDGLWVGDVAFLAALAAAQGVEEADFHAAYAAAPLDEHLAQSQQWLRRLGGHGYPTLGVERDGVLMPLSPSFGEPAHFLAQLRVVS